MTTLDFYFTQPDFLIPDNLTTAILETSNALPYHESLKGYQPTPLRPLRQLAEELGVGEILLKDESFRFGLNAFKALGASFAVHQRLKNDPQIEVFCTATDGNHGRALAWSAANSGKKSVVFVPSDTNIHRIKAIEREGATVIQLNNNYDEACIHAARACKLNNWELIQDTAWNGYESVPAYIMAGYLTQFKELEHQIEKLDIPDYDVVFLQVGVGSWAGAAAYYMMRKFGGNCPKIVTVEPSGSAGLLHSFQAKKRVKPRENSATIMAGLSCGIPSLTGWEFLKHAVTVAISIPDEYAKLAMRKLYHPLGTDKRVIAGESGAAGIAGLMAVLKEPAFNQVVERLALNSSSRILVFNTEGDTDPEHFNKVVSP